MTTLEAFTAEDLIALDGAIALWERFAADFLDPQCDQAHAGATSFYLRLRAKIAMRVEQQPA